MLDASSDEKDLKKGSKVELPFWMVPTLYEKKVVSFEIPRFYRVNYRFKNVLSVLSFFIIFIFYLGKFLRLIVKLLIYTSGGLISMTLDFTLQIWISKNPQT